MDELHRLFRLFNRRFDQGLQLLVVSVQLNFLDLCLSAKPGSERRLEHFLLEDAYVSSTGLRAPQVADSDRLVACICIIRCDRVCPVGEDSL